MFQCRLSQFPESRQTECNVSFVRNLFSVVDKQWMMLSYAEEEEEGIGEGRIALCAMM